MHVCMFVRLFFFIYLKIPNNLETFCWVRVSPVRLFRASHVYIRLWFYVDLEWRWIEWSIAGRIAGARLTNKLSSTTLSLPSLRSTSTWRFSRARYTGCFHGAWWSTSWRATCLAATWSGAGIPGIRRSITGTRLTITSSLPLPEDTTVSTYLCLSLSSLFWSLTSLVIRGGFVA